MSIRKTIDVRGAFCPGPLMEVVSGIKHSDIGDEVEVWSSDQGTIEDLPVWCANAGHELIEKTECDGYWRLVVKKGK